MTERVAWWLMGCPFSKPWARITCRPFWQDGQVPFDYRLGMRLMLMR